MTEPLPIRNVSGTALWVAIYCFSTIAQVHGTQPPDAQPATGQRADAVLRTMRGTWYSRLLSKLQSKTRLEASRRMSGIVLLATG
jgi:hypothetical protein